MPLLISYAVRIWLRRKRPTALSEIHYSLTVTCKKVPDGELMGLCTLGAASYTGKLLGNSTLTLIDS